MTIGRDLPDDTAAHLRALRSARDPQWKALAVAAHERGYSLGAIGAAAGVSRQRIHAIVTSSARLALADGDSAPPEVAGHKRKTRAQALPADDAKLMAELWELSSARRGATRQASLTWRAHALLARQVTDLVRLGFSFDSMADAIGVDRRTFRGRMLRAGITRKGVNAG